MQRYVLFILGTIVLSAGIAGVVTADGGPLAAPGLDQEVGVNTTVQLDGTGSSHPDGRIDGYEWSIETPDGRTMTPACRDCARTSFTPRSVGRYDVTLTVTDGEGRTDSDTLYVYVEEVGPTVGLSGDADPAVDDPTPYNASARAGDADLETLTWKLDNRTVVRESMDGQADWTRRSFSFTEADTYRLAVIARDASNRTARDTLTVEPRDAPEATGGESGASGGTGDGTSDTGSDDAADTGSDNESDIVVLPQHDSSGGYVVEDRMGGGDVEGERKDETGGWHREPAEGGGVVTIVSPHYEGDLPPGPKGPTVSPSENDMPVRDQAAPDTGSRSGTSSNTGSGLVSRISETASIPGFTSGGGGGSGGSSGGGGSGGSGGSSGGGSSGGGPSFTPGGVGVI
jgi:hypothetical protein